MSSVNDSTSYQVNVAEEYSGCEGYISFGSGGPGAVDDAFVLALAQAIKDLPWPAGANLSLAANKVVSHSENYNADLAIDPPAFQ